jgi:hypothetical protein
VVVIGTETETEKEEEEDVLEEG